MNNQESMLVIESRHTAFYLRQKSSTYEQLLNLKPYFESFLKDSFSEYGMEIPNCYRFKFTDVWKRRKIRCLVEQGMLNGSISSIKRFRPFLSQHFHRTDCEVFISMMNDIKI